MPDPYHNPDAHPSSTLEAIATRLEERGENHAFKQMIMAYAQHLPADRPIKLLDLGCGTGVVVRHLAEVLHKDSTLHGADISQELLKTAKAHTDGKMIQWDHIQAGPLPYEDHQFDVVVMHTLLSHVPDVHSLLRDAKRILQTEGQLIVFDADHAGTTYAQPDYETTRRIDHLLISAIVTHPDICRQLPRLFKETGFSLQDHTVDVISECGHGEYWLSSVHGFAKLMPVLKVLTEEEADAWVHHMLEAHENGTFFAAGAFYTFFATPE